MGGTIIYGFFNTFLEIIASIVHFFFFLTVTWVLFDLNQKPSQIYPLVTIQFVFWTSTLFDRVLVWLIFVFLFNLAKETDKLKAKVKINFDNTFRIFSTTLFCYLVQGYKFDWKNRIRLVEKLDATALYRNIYLLITAAIYCKVSQRSEYSDSVDAIVDFFFGSFFVLVSINLSHEYRMENAKLFEGIYLAFSVLKILRVRKILARHLEISGGKLKVKTVTQKLGNRKTKIEI